MSAAIWVRLGAATLAAVLLSGFAKSVTAEASPRPVAYRAPRSAALERVWGPFAFGMSLAEAGQAAAEAGGRLAVPGSDGVAGQPHAYHGPRIRQRSHAAGDYALVRFEAGRLSEVTVVVFRVAAWSAKACMAAHRRATAVVLASGSARRIVEPTMGSFAPGGEGTWKTELWQGGSRVLVETVWEDVASAAQAGGDETCTGTVAYRPL